MASQLVSAPGTGAAAHALSSGRRCLQALGIGLLRVCCASIVAVGIISAANAQALPPGSFTGWGNTVLNDTLPPNISPPLTDAYAISSYYGKTVALRGNGTVVVWGDQAGALTPPQDLNDAIAVATSESFMMALRRNGTVVFWGSYPAAGPFVDGSLTDVIAIAANKWNGAALKRDGTVIHWSTFDGSLIPAPKAGAGIIAIAVGYKYGLGLKKDGTVVAWGSYDEDSSFGQLEVPQGLNKVVAIASGVLTGLALKEDGTVVAWGSDGDGLVSGASSLAGIKAITAQYYHALAITNVGEVRAWGFSGFGATTVPPGITNVRAVSVGVFNSFALNPPYTFSGFQSPVDSSPTVNLGKAGRTYPVKWQLKNINDTSVSALSAVRSINVMSNLCGAFSSDLASALENTSIDDTPLVYQASTRQYIYNWKTPGAGCYTLFLTLDSGEVFTAYFNLSK